MVDASESFLEDTDHPLFARLFPIDEEGALLGLVPGNTELELSS